MEIDDIITRQCNTEAVSQARPISNCKAYKQGLAFEQASFFLDGQGQKSLTLPGPSRPFKRPQIVFEISPGLVGISGLVFVDSVIQRQTTDY